MSSTMYSYPETLEAYRKTLTRNPGKALDTGSGIVALLDFSGEVYGAFLDCSTGQLDRACAFDFDERTFRDGHWDGQSTEETAATIRTPRLIDITLF